MHSFNYLHVTTHSKINLDLDSLRRPILRWYLQNEVPVAFRQIVNDGLRFF